jgi:hypothetical protein
MSKPRPWLQGEKNPHSKLTDEIVVKAREMYREGYVTKVIRNRLAPYLSSQNFHKMLIGQTWKHVKTP